jgi:hypothetical protein
MSQHEPFNFKSLEELKAKINRLGANLPLSDALA